MLRRTAPARSLPLIKLAVLATRQATKPIVKHIVLSSATHPRVNALCIHAGRLSYGVSSLVFRMAVADARAGAASPLASKPAPAAASSTSAAATGAAPGRAAAGASGPPVAAAASSLDADGSGDVSAEEAAALPEGAELLRRHAPAPAATGGGGGDSAAATAAPLPPKTAVGSGGAAPAAAAAAAASTAARLGGATGGAAAAAATPSWQVRMWQRAPLRQLRRTWVRHFHPPLPDASLRDAGAELLVELLVFLIAALILSYELAQNAAAAAEKERRLFERISQLEAKIDELAAVGGVARLADQPAAARAGMFRRVWASTVAPVVATAAAVLALSD